MRWLAELARAIDEAQQIVWGLTVQRGDNPRTRALYGQLEAARDEVERLQRGVGRQANIELRRNWSELLAGVAASAGAMDETA